MMNYSRNITVSHQHINQPFKDHTKLGFQLKKKKKTKKNTILVLVKCGNYPILHVTKTVTLTTVPAGFMLFSNNNPRAQPSTIT